MEEDVFTVYLALGSEALEKCEIRDVQLTLLIDSVSKLINVDSELEVVEGGVVIRPDTCDDSSVSK